MKTETKTTAHSSDARPHHGGMVVGVDGSDGSNAALRWAAARTSQFGPIQPVTTWHFPWWLAPNPFPGAPLPPPPQQFQQETERHVEQILSAGGVKEYKDPIVTRGPAGPTLVRYGNDAEMIVVGTRGRGAAADALLGSVSRHVVAHATVPVAVVPEQAKVGHPLKRVVVGIDGSDNSIAALAWAIKTTPDDATLEAVHVWHYVLSTLPESGTIDTHIFELQAQQTLDAAVVKATLAAGGTRHEIVHRLEYGDPRNLLREISSEADLLVLGGQGHRGVTYLVIGSVTTGLTHKPLVSTVVVPASGQAAKA